jgi:hypothetical protein
MTRDVARESIRDEEEFMPSAPENGAPETPSKSPEELASVLEGRNKRAWLARRNQPPENQRPGARLFAPAPVQDRGQVLCSVPRTSLFQASIMRTRFALSSSRVCYPP